MITDIELINFKRHEHLQINFAGGMNVIKGNNEDGKTSILEAFGYAFWGTRFLPESLDETVTWGKPVNSLRVNMGFTHDGAAFTITRGKSGAELNGPGVKVSGQDAVTNFIEGLFGVTMAMAKMILIASQDEVRGSLNAGAVQLIEKLANMKLIDDTINNIQTYLSSGNTKALDAQITTLEASLVKPEEDDTAERLEVANSEKIVKLSADKLEAARSEEARLMVDASAANRALAESRAALQANQAKAARLASVKAEVAKIALPALGDLDALMQSQAAQQQQQGAVKAWTAWQKLPAFSQQWDSREQIELLIAAQKAEITTLQNLVRRLDIDIGRKEATTITQTACGLCGKDLSEVPEVVATNARIAEEISSLLADKEAATSKLNKLQTELRTNEQQYNIGATIDNQMTMLSDYVDFGTDKWPRPSVWKGPEIPDAPDLTDYAKLIEREKAARLASASALSKKAALEAEIASLQAEVDSFVPEDTTPYETAIEAYNKSNKALETVRQEYATAERALSKARNDLSLKQQAYLLAVQAYDTNKLQLDKLKTIAKDTEENNQLIKKLRDVRPIVAKRLWNIVLSSVSSIFSRIRGTTSTVTRTDDEFLIDGRPIGAYSGSTKDALGLAIRIALQKTFLTGLDFIIVDEPARGMDDTRETDLLAVLTTSEFAQTFVVTHSTLADAYATNLIQLGE